MPKHLIPPFAKRLIYIYVLLLAVLTGISFPYGSGEPYIPYSQKILSHTASVSAVLGNVIATAPNGFPKKTAVSTDPWGVAKQIDEHTWTMRINDDKTMATPHEILDALNNYRQKHGSGTLNWDDNLAAYAQTRADYFTSLGKLDEHAGFSSFIDNEDGFHKLGFASLGENSSIGYKMEGVHLIEWIYAGDKDHNDNQLNSKWTDVGIGVNGTATDLIFAANRL